MTVGSGISSLIRTGVGPICRFVASNVTKGDARILMYHRFQPRSHGRHMPASQFERQVKLISKRMRPIRLTDLIDGLESGGPLPSRCIVLTIDDGYRDFYEVAVPILERYRVPATLFPVSAFVDQKQWLWFDAIRFLLEKADSKKYGYSLQDEEITLSLHVDGGLERAWSALARRLLPMSTPDRLDKIRDLSACLGTTLPSTVTAPYEPITWHELTSLDPDLFDIGCHSATHARISRCSDFELIEELAGSRQLLESRLQRQVDIFCYPNGMPGDYDNRTKEALRVHGYRAGIVAHGGFTGRRTDLMEITRIGEALKFSDFKSAISGLDEIRSRISRNRVGATMRQGS